MSSTDKGFDDFDRTGLLIEESQKFCRSLGLEKDLVLKIYKSDSDWAFLLRIDALLEPTKCVMSAEGKARIAAAQKLRWAKSRPAAKKAAKKAAVKSFPAKKAIVKKAAPAKSSAIKA